MSSTKAPKIPPNILTTSPAGEPLTSPMPPARFSETVNSYKLVTARGHGSLTIQPGAQFFFVDFLTAAENNLVTTPTIFAWSDDQVTPIGVITMTKPNAPCQEFFNSLEEDLVFRNPAPPSPTAFKTARPWTPIIERRFGPDALVQIKECIDLREKSLRKKEWNLATNATAMMGPAYVVQQFCPDPAPAMSDLALYLLKVDLPKATVARAAIILSLVRPFYFFTISEFLAGSAGATANVLPIAALAVAAERSGHGREDAFWTYSIGSWELFVAEKPAALPAWDVNLDLGMRTFRHINHAQLAAFAVARNALTVEINRRAETSFQVDSIEAGEQMTRYIDAKSAWIRDVLEQERQAEEAAEDEPEVRDGPGPTTGM